MVEHFYNFSHPFLLYDRKSTAFALKFQRRGYRAKFWINIRKLLGRNGEFTSRIYKKSSCVVPINHLHYSAPTNCTYKPNNYVCYLNSLKMKGNVEVGIFIHTAVPKMAHSLLTA
jgi:hypothetical protein